MLGERAEDAGRIDQSISMLESIGAQLARSSVLWSYVQDNLGNAFMAMGRAAEALTAYQASLDARCSVSERARSLSNQGTAHLALGHSAQAYDCFQGWPLALIRRDRSPLAWGRISNTTSPCAQLQRRHWPDESQNAGDGLRAAVAAFEAALEERQRSRLPLDWAITTANLAGALVALGTHLRIHRPVPDGETGLSGHPESGPALRGGVT